MVTRSSRNSQGMWCVAECFCVQCLWESAAHARCVCVVGLRHKGEVTCLAYSPVLALIASGATDGEVRVWDFDKQVPQLSHLTAPSSARWIVLIEG